ncbi:MAG: FAD-dependent monooxygenase [Gammaproteobacteria bacterium]
MKRRADVVIVGGGMVGGSLAASLASEGFDVVVLDAGDAPVAPEGAAYAPRVVAVSRASERLLRHCGAWQHMSSARVAPYGGMRVWDAAGSPIDDDALAFSAHEIGEPNLGHIVENDLVAAAAFQAAQAQASLSWHTNTRVNQISINERRARVETDDGGVISAPLVVAADGARSECRDLLGVAVRRGSYEQSAVVTHVRGSQSHEDTAWQRFLPSGPLALLPLADGRCSIVWSTTPDHAAELMACDGATFCAQLSKASAGVFGDITECSKRYTFPLQWLHVERYSGARFAIVGDAAHVVHPLAGLGVNLGLADVASLAAALVAARQAERDIGDAPVLRPFARERKAQNALMLDALSGLHRLFSNEAFGLSLARRFGLRAVNRASPLRRFFARRAMGLD